MKLDEFDFVENSIINILASDGFHRVQWVEPSAVLVKGSSFSSVYITIAIAKLIQEGYLKLDDVLEQLKVGAVNVHTGVDCIHYDDTFIKDIKKAIVFPFNKEIHALARFKHNLLMDIVGFYDVKYSMIVGKSMFAILNIDSEDVVKNYNDICWTDDFDTVILGHCSELNQLSGKNWIIEIINKALQYNKKIFSLEDISSYMNKDNLDKLYFPHIDNTMVPKNRFGKLRSINVPILGIFKTSSQQGKFTLQMILRNIFTENNYCVGQLGTEPTSQLFGIDRVYPMGYHSTVSIGGHESITMLNEQLWEISILNKNPDIIVVGGQGYSIPFSYNHLSHYPLSQIEFEMGVLPDIVVLCVNPHDPIDYIKRTIIQIESLTDTFVIGLVLFPKLTESTNIAGKFKTRLLSSDELLSFKLNIETSVGKDVFILNESDDILSLFDNIVEFFSK